MKKTRRIYTSEFMLEAIRLSETSDKGDAQIERDLGISTGCLYRWKKKFAKDGEHAFPGRGRLNPEQEQLRRLEREVKLLRQERDILKRSRRCFASLPSSRTQANEIPVH